MKEPGFYSLVPDDFTGVTPKVVVKEQEYVMAGGPLFIDKNHPELKFVSPVSGVVTSVERGAKRKVMNIVEPLPNRTTKNLARWTRPRWTGSR